MTYEDYAALFQRLKEGQRDAGTAAASAAAVGGQAPAAAPQLLSEEAYVEQCRAFMTQARRPAGAGAVGQGSARRRAHTCHSCLPALSASWGMPQVLSPAFHLCPDPDQMGMPFDAEVVRANYRAMQAALQQQQQVAAAGAPTAVPA